MDTRASASSKIVKRTITCDICLDEIQYEEPENSADAADLPDGYLLPDGSWICDECGSCPDCGSTLEKELSKRAFMDGLNKLHGAVPCRNCEAKDVDED